MGRNWAITVGINRYGYLQDLSYAVQDAEAMRDYFLGDLGCPREQVYHFSDVSEPIPQDYGPPQESQPTRTNLRRFLRERFKQPFLQAGDNLWFFFAGHGCFHENRDYLMPLDGDPGDVGNTAIPLHEVVERLRGSGADNVILCIDACRSSSGQRDGVGIGTEPQRGVITFFSCSPKESAYEIEALKAGAFTYALLESLRIEGAENCATVERLYERLRRRVPEINQDYGKPRQIPYACIEPICKASLILSLRQASASDLVKLRYTALQAELTGEMEIARQIWLRLLVVSPTDLEALQGIMRISSKSSESDALSLAKKTGDSAREGEKYSFWDRFFRRTESTQEKSKTLQPTKKEFDIANESINQPEFEKNPIENNIKSKPKIDIYKSDFWEKELEQAGIEKKSVKYAYIHFNLNENGDENLTSGEREQMGFEEKLTPDLAFSMIFVPGGSYNMGCSPGDDLCERFEHPRHEVSLPGFFMSQKLVTCKIWEFVSRLPQANRFLADRPSSFEMNGDGEINIFPVDQISWLDAVEFCDRLSSFSGKCYRLPSESEWEYSCRAGSSTRFYFGNEINKANVHFDIESSSNNLAPRTRGVDFCKASNLFGLYDMHGNLYEWCLDDWHKDYIGAPNNEKPWMTDKEEYKKVIRGGSWYSFEDDCRSSSRHWKDCRFGTNYIGLRLVCDGFKNKE